MSTSSIVLLIALIWVSAAILIAGLYLGFRWLDRIPAASPWRRRLRGVALLLALAIFIMGAIGGIQRLGKRMSRWQGEANPTTSSPPAIPPSPDSVRE
jgi:hypothetical protein